MKLTKYDAERSLPSDQCNELTAALERLLLVHPNISTVIVSRSLFNSLKGFSHIVKVGEYFQLKLAEGTFGNTTVNVLVDDALDEQNVSYNNYFSPYTAQEIIADRTRQFPQQIRIEINGVHGVIDVDNRVNGLSRVNNTLAVLYEKIEVVERLLRESLEEYVRERHNLNDEQSEFSIESIFIEKLSLLHVNTQ